MTKNISRTWLILLTASVILSCETYEVDLPCESNVICIEVKCADNDFDDCLNTLVADGNKRLLVTATVPKEIDPAKNKITFRSTTGEFVGEISTQAPELQAVNGKATTILRIGNQAGTFKISAEVSDGTTTYQASEEIDLDTVPRPFFKFDFGSVDTSELLADGSTILLVRTNLIGIDQQSKQLTLRASGGWGFAHQTDQTITYTIGQYPYFDSFLQLGQTPGPCFLSAEVDGSSSSILIQTHRADPTEITLVPESQVIDSANGTLQIRAYLIRPTGKVSIGTQVRFSSRQDQPGTIVDAGWFDPPFPVSDANGHVTVDFHTWADGTVVSQIPIQIKAWVLNNIAVADSINIYPK